MAALTSPLIGADSGTFQIWSLNKNSGGVESIRGETLKAVLRQAGGNGRLLLSFAES